LAQSANPLIGKWKVTWQKDGVDRQASLVIEESWSGAPVQANTAMLQPLLEERCRNGCNVSRRSAKRTRFNNQ
jgi:hypothetical protein